MCVRVCVLKKKKIEGTDNNNMAALLLSVFVLMSASLSLAHVSLTFPPARKYALDFMDTVRSVSELL